MAPYVNFIKRCIKCNRSSEIPNLILFEGYDEMLDPKNSYCLNELEIIDRLYDWHEEQEIKCEYCNVTNKFLFSNVIINDQPARKDNITHYDYLSRLYLLAVAFEEYRPVIIDIDPETHEVIKSEINNYRQKAILNIDEETVKVIITTDFKKGIIVFVGRILMVEYTEDGKISEINGETKHPLGGTYVAFKLKYGIETIGKKRVKSIDNYFLEISPSPNDQTIIRGFLLIKTRSTNGEASVKTAYKGELY